MASPHVYGGLKLVYSDEFSLDDPVNTSNVSGRRDRLVRLDRDNPNFAEGV